MGAGASVGQKNYGVPRRSRPRRKGLGAASGQVDKGQKRPGHLNADLEG